MIKVHFLVLTLFLSGCAEHILTGAKRKNLDTVFRGGQVEKYFLSDLPGWILFSEIKSFGRWQLKPIL